MRKSIFVRIFLGYLIIIFILAIFIPLFSFRVIERYHALFLETKYPQQKKNIDQLFSLIKIRIIEIVALVIVFALFISYFFSRSLSNPIKKLAIASDKIARGDLDTKIDINSKDEIGKFAEGFNHMIERVRGLFSELKLKQEELSLVISAIQEGIVVIDETGKIKLYNESFKNMIGREITGEEFYKEVFKNLELIDIIERAIKEKRHFNREIAINDRIFLCDVTFLGSRGEIVAVFYDITDFRKLEKIKRDFVANVSHELRTPLTAIKGYVETLEDELEGPMRRYLDVIGRNTERLINIVQDLLTLSKLEEPETQIEIEDVKLVELVEGIVKIFREKALEKNLTLKLLAEGNIPIIKADPFKLEQMFINLIDNAIKYTEKGGISVYLKSNKEKVTIIVEDTGIGIPESHITRIFERFYVVDKSRSRRLGGTGLGLSIVKHIVLLHKGNLKLESTPGKGTKFIIDLPISP